MRRTALRAGKSFPFHAARGMFPTAPRRKMPFLAYVARKRAAPGSVLPAVLRTERNRFRSASRFMLPLSRE